MPTHLSDHIPGSPGPHRVITAKSTIERQATEAAGAGKTLNESCPYPFGSPAADHFKAVYLRELPPDSDLRAQLTQPAPRELRVTAWSRA